MLLISGPSLQFLKDILEQMIRTEKAPQMIQTDKNSRALVFPFQNHKCGTVWRETLHSLPFPFVSLWGSHETQVGLECSMY